MAAYLSVLSYVNILEENKQENIKIVLGNLNLVLLIKILISQVSHTINQLF